MSYNIDDIKVLDGQLSIRAADARKLKREARGNTPEDSFIDDLVKLLQEDDVPQVIELDMAEFRWRGEGSGSTWHEYFLQDVAPLLRGRADLVIIWEGGDSISGLRIIDGNAEEMDVRYELVPAESEGDPHG